MPNLKIYIQTLIALFMTAALMFSVAVPAMASLGPQEWYLSNVDSTVSGKNMTRTYNSATGSVDIAAGATKFWLTDVAAAVDVKFPDGAWIIQLKTDSFWGDQDSSNCIMNVGEWNTSGSNFSPFLTSTEFNLTYDNGTHIMRIELQLNSETVHQYNYIGLRIQNTDTENHMVYTDGESSMKSPNSDPGFPTPEIHPNSFATIIASQNAVSPGTSLTLTITDTNNGDVPIRYPSMDLIADSGTFHMNLNKLSPSFSGGDPNDNGLFDPGETWKWIVQQVIVTEKTTFTATGHGQDPYGNDVTAPDFPTEQADVTVGFYPFVPDSTKLGAGIMIGGMAAGMVLLMSRRTRQSRLK